MALLVAGCDRDSGNVMAPAQNALSPEQVDAALGPELGNESNLLAPSDELNEVQPVEAPAPAEPSPPERRTTREPEPAAEPESEQPAPTEPEQPANNSVEE